MAEGVSITPLWITLFLGLLGPVATITTVLITSRSNVHKLQEERAESRRAARRERFQDRRDRRTEFEIEHLRRLIDAIMSLGRLVARASFALKEAEGLKDARLDDDLDEQLRAAQIEMRVTIELVLDDSIRQNATQLQRTYTAALTCRSSALMSEKLVVADPVASALTDTAAARIRQLHNELEESE